MRRNRNDDRHRARDPGARIQRRHVATADTGALMGARMILIMVGVMPALTMMTARHLLARLFHLARVQHRQHQPAQRRRGEEQHGSEPRGAQAGNHLDRKSSTEREKARRREGAPTSSRGAKHRRDPVPSSAEGYGIASPPSAARNDGVAAAARSACLTRAASSTISVTPAMAGSVISRLTSHRKCSTPSVAAT